jgi:hypothetical protein
LTPSAAVLDSNISLDNSLKKKRKEEEEKERRQRREEEGPFFFLFIPMSMKPNN